VLPYHRRSSECAHPHRPAVAQCRRPAERFGFGDDHANSVQPAHDRPDAADETAARTYDTASSGADLDDFRADVALPAITATRPGWDEYASSGKAARLSTVHHSLRARNHLPRAPRHPLAAEPSGTHLAARHSRAANAQTRPKCRARVNTPPPQPCRSMSQHVECRRILTPQS